jgi:hypothetical protein
MDELPYPYRIFSVTAVSIFRSLIKLRIKKVVFQRQPLNQKVLDFISQSMAFIPSMMAGQLKKFSRFEKSNTTAILLFLQTGFI